MDPNVIEERKKVLDLGYFDEYISEDENEFEVQKLVEDGEVVDPMLI